MKDININEKIFRGKHIADMQGELDLCGNVVSNVPASVVDTSGDQVAVSTTCIDAGGAEKSSTKHAERGRIPSFLIFHCLLLVKRGSKC